MSVSTNSNTDRSTENANWGTLVILLVLVFVAGTIGVILYSDSQKPAAPITLSVPAPTAPPASAAMQSAPGAAAPASPNGSPAGATNGGQ